MIIPKATSRKHIRVTRLRHTIQQFSVTTRGALRHIINIHVQDRPDVARVRRHNQVNVTQVRTFRRNLDRIRNLILPGPIDGLRVLNHVQFDRINA